MPLEGVFRIDSKADDLSPRAPQADVLDDGGENGLVAEVFCSNMAKQADSLRSRNRHPSCAPSHSTNCSILSRISFAPGSDACIPIRGALSVYRSSAGE